MKPARRATAPLRGSLGRTLLLVGVVQSAVLIASGAILFSINERMRHALDDATDAFVDEQRLADRILNGVVRQLVAASAYEHEGDARLRDEFNTAGAEIQSQLRQYLFRDLSSEERLKLEEVKERHQRLEVAATRTLQLMDLGDPASAGRAGRAMAEHALELEAAIQAFLRLRQEDLQALRDRQRDAFHRLYLAAGLLGLLALLAAIGVAYFLYHRLATPLADLTAAAERIGRGDVWVRVRTPAEDELAALATSFNQMADGIEVARGDLERRNEELARALDRLRETQAELVQTEKLSAMGRMVAGLAHELNNPLASVLGYAQLLQARLDEGRLPVGELREEYVSPIAAEAARARELVQNLLAFARKSDTRLGAVSLTDALRVVAGLRSYAFEQAGLRLEVGRVPPLWVRAEGQRLQQVLLNILNNAFDALRPRGRGEVSVRAHTSGSRVVVVIEDDGPGFADPERVFEPFYTTKPVGEGTGLGLALVHRFMEEFDGNAYAENRPEGGARVTLSFRAASPPVALSPPPAEPSNAGLAANTDPKRKAGRVGARAPSGRPLRILVVEDEAPLRALQKKLLARLGAEVLLASAGREASELLRHAEVDLVISDVKMPGGSGLELYRWIEKERPELADRFLFVTGDVGDPEIAALAAEYPERFIRKPFQMQEYLGRVSAWMA